MGLESSDIGQPPVEGVEPSKALARVVNPTVKALLRSPLHWTFSRHLMLLSFRGRKTGRTYDIVVGRHEVEGTLLVPTGTTGRRWRLNFRGGAPTEVMIEGRRLSGRGELIEDPDEVARLHQLLLGRVGLNNARRLGLRVNVDRQPTHDELKVPLAGCGMISVDLD